MSFGVCGRVLLLLWTQTWRLPPTSLPRSPSLFEGAGWGLFIWQSGYVANWSMRIYCGSHWILYSSFLPCFTWQMPSTSYEGPISLMLSISQMTWSMTSLVRLVSCPPLFRRYAYFSLHFPSFFFSCISAHSDIQTWCLYQADPTSGVLVDPPNLP